MCQIIGLFPISIKGFGIREFSSFILVPYPPAKITNFIIFLKSLFIKYIIILFKFYIDYSLSASFLKLLN